MPSAFHIGYLAALKSSAEKGSCKHSPLICAPFAHADRTNAVLTGGIHPRLIQLTSHLQMAARMQPVLPRLPTNILPAPCWPTSSFFFLFFFPPRASFCFHRRISPLFMFAYHANEKPWLATYSLLTPCNLLNPCSRWVQCFMIACFRRGRNNR